MRSFCVEEFEATYTTGTCVWCGAEDPQFRCSLVSQARCFNKVHTFCDVKCYYLDKKYRGYKVPDQYRQPQETPQDNQAEYDLTTDPIEG